MSETADVANNLPAIILLSFWWAFLSMLELLSRQGDPTHRPCAGGQAGAAQAPEDEPDFPELREVEPDFRASAFLQGACRAYEEILRAYALCDAKALQVLLSAEVFRAFMDAFEARSAQGETLELTFVGIQSAAIAGVEVRSEAVEIAVLFRAQVIQAERSSDGDIIRGDPGEVAAVADLWTFSRPRSIGATSWTVIATGEPLETP
ncbi:MAG: Tim44 domain-containing protein [Mesorhizobium sp.]|jgi:predicted lipid-binding transport protein (Tim44 family)|nr:Tim44/TimA family putative adaptor protein [Mesorhizobium sp.]MBL8579258.1 Tim44 domain-containing protein [Mesorhizobium sp.]